MRKRVLSLLFAGIIALSLLPVSTLAYSGLYGDTNGTGTIEVILTISEGIDDFYTTEAEEQILLRELSVPYFDLALYDLEGYYYNPNCYASGYQTAGNAQMADGVVTTMHVFIYATEVFMCGIAPEDAGKGLGADYIAGYGKPREEGQYLSWTGGVGSSFMTFWNDSTNLNYFLDYEYPLGRAGWGSTSDQQALQDGAAIEVHLIKDQDAQGSQYGYFVGADGGVDMGSVEEGSSVNLTLYSTNSWYGGTNTPTPLAGAAVYMTSRYEYYGESVTKWTAIGYTDDNGQIGLPTDMEPGTYYIGSPGKVAGASERAPAVYLLNVTESYDIELYGDADGDGDVTSKDAALVLQAVAQKEVYIDTVSADVDGDGILTSKDAACILRYVAKKISIFPVEENIN